MKKIITIDGMASSGKSTLSRRLSKKIKWPWFSTGVLYRGMAFVGHKEKFSDQDYLSFFKSSDWRIELTEEKSLFFYKGKDISGELYKEDIDDLASLFSAKIIFRKALIAAQRAFYKDGPGRGLILEGRDCGTVIFPSAPLKVFLSAGEGDRAKRRAEDRKQAPEDVILAQRKRDQRDQSRLFAPLARPEGALELDSGRKKPEELAELVFQRAREIFS